MELYGKAQGMKTRLFRKEAVNIRNRFLEYSVWDLGLGHDWG